MIHCADAIKWLHETDIEPQLILTSPPYGTIRNYDGCNFSFLEFRTLAIHLARILKPGGVLVWIRRDQYHKGSQNGESWRQAAFFTDHLGLRLHDIMIYAKNNPLPVGGAKRYNQHWEYMFVFTKGSPNTFNPIQVPAKYKGLANVRNRDKDGKGTYKKVERKPLKKIGNIWYYTLGKGHQGFSQDDDKLVHQHPAIFPLQLPLDHIRTWTNNKQDLVLDPMCGSGQTCIAAKMLGRQYIGIDVNQQYIDIANQRMALYDQTPSSNLRFR